MSLTRSLAPRSLGSLLLAPLLLVPAQAALAMPVEGALQLRLTPAALDLAADQVEDLDPVLTEDEVSATDVECYDLLGIRDFNLSVPIDSVTLTPGNGTLRVQVELGTVHGEDMIVFGVDEDYLDACPEFESELVYATLTDGALDATLSARRSADGALELSWAAAPVVTGDLDTDISWFPDDLVLYFVEDAIFEQIGLTVAEELPPVVEELLGEAAIDGGYGDFEGGLALAEVELTPDGLWLSAEAAVSFTGEPACDIPSNPILTLDRTELALADEGDDHVGVGLTERFVGELLGVAWQAGWFCIESDAVADVVEDLASLVDPDVVTGRGYGSLDAAPVLRMTADGMLLDLSGLRVTVEGQVDGEPRDLIDMTLDMTAQAGLTLDPGTGSVVLELIDPKIDITDMDLVGFQAGSEGLVTRHVEKMVTRSVAEELSRIALFDGLYRGFGLVVRMDRFTPEQDGLAVWLRLYDEADPAVDDSAPDCTVDIVEVGADSIEVAWQGTDDRADALAFAWQVDGTGWSDWTNDGGAVIEDLDPGEHIVEVKVRDAWLNEDATPATVSATLSEKGLGLLPENCGCSGVAPVGMLGLPGLLALIGRRRRRA
ncbi:MAG: hypothetical protein H6742_01365 [Alphaproteobacteria bacterium]|nr:hypothetical protein [Alphaproteobacteria bacterium]